MKMRHEFHENLSFSGELKLYLMKRASLRTLDTLSRLKGIETES